MTVVDHFSKMASSVLHAGSPSINGGTRIDASLDLTIWNDERNPFGQWHRIHVIFVSRIVTLHG